MSIKRIRAFKNTEEFRKYMREYATIYRKKHAKEISERRSNYYKFNDGHKKQKALQLKERYGITYEVFERMLISQEGLCVICKGRNNKRELSVDHNHETGKVRELLCYKCNTIIGLSGENINTLEAIINYLKKHNATV